MMIPILKIIAIIGIFAFTLLTSVTLPVFSRCYDSTNRIRPRAWFYYLLLFSCTLIASTGINHVLPNAIDAFDGYKDGWGYPYPGIICTFSIIVSWALDVIMDPRKQTV